MYFYERQSAFVGIVHIYIRVYIYGLMFTAYLSTRCKAAAADRSIIKSYRFVDEYFMHDLTKNKLLLIISYDEIFMFNGST